MMLPARFPLPGTTCPSTAIVGQPQSAGAPSLLTAPAAPSLYAGYHQSQTSSYYGCSGYNNNNNNNDWNNYQQQHCGYPGYGDAALQHHHRDFASPPDNYRHHVYGSYYCSTASSSMSSSSSSASSSASVSPMSSVSPPSSATYRQYFPPNQTHDCHGVPAHPSVADFSTQPQYYHHQQHRDSLPSHYTHQQRMVSLSPQEQMPPPQHNNNNNNNNYSTMSPYDDAARDFLKNAGNNSSRQMRNLAEKQRRNKLNTCINELSQLVPLISNASKKIEKTSVLRLSAAYLRLSRLLMGLKEQREEMPVYIKKVNLADLLLDDRDIFLMVTSAGKIVFVSHSVEHILGHPQIDLMGQSLFGISCPEDHDELRENLQFKDETSFEIKTEVSADDDPAEVAKLESGCKMQRRSFYMRLVKKAVSRGEQPEYKLVHVVGTLMVYNGSKNPLVGGDEIVLNAVVRPYNERRVTEVSMLEATREEYITRHQIDGRIIYVDHRISIVSGFMPQEVSGQLAFTYMHKEDVRWVMIALRQMFFKGLSYGSSCYRLLSKNGEFVYMKTYGYLELNSNEDKIGSFICVNTLVSEKEGKSEIKKMKERFTPLIRSQSEPGIAAITAITNDNISVKKDSTLSDDSESNCYTEDLSTLNKFVEQMIINIPKPAIDNVKETAQNPGPLPDSQYAKVALLSKSMPPVSTTSSELKSEKQLSISPQPKSKQPPVQDRPSVLCVAPRKPVVVLNHLMNEQTTEKDREYFERRGGILVVPKRHIELIPEHSPKKAKTETRVDSPTCSQYSNQMDGLQSDNQLSTDSCSSLDGLSSFQNTPIQLNTLNANELESEPLPNVNITDFNPYTNMFDDTPLNPVLSESFNSYDNVIFNHGSSADIINQDSLQEDRSIENELLIKQIKIKTNIDQQKSQLKEIQTKLHSLPKNADTHFLKTNFSDLQAEYEKHEQLLLSIQQGVHQNIGV